MRTRWLAQPQALLAVVALTVPLLAFVAAAPAVAAGAPPAVVINEVESNGGDPGDWVELYDNASTPVDLTGYVFRDNDDKDGYVLPSGSTIAGNGFLVLNEADFDFGLGASDEARLFEPDSSTLVDSYTWTSHAAVTYGRCPDGTGAFETTTTSTKGAANDCGTPPPSASPVKINEVESSGGTPGDWIELADPTASAADISGFVVKDSDDTHVYTIPASTSIAAHGYYVVEEADLGFGLGSADSARLFEPDGTTLVDSYSWTAHATTTYGRCPDSTGALTTTAASTKGAANDCGTAAPPTGPTGSPWPGGSTVHTADDANFFGENLSGLVYQGSGNATPGTLWAVKNGPGTLYKLKSDGTTWRADAGDWSNGKSLHYPDGTGDPDSEGVTFADGDPDAGVFVSTERNNDDDGVSRPEVLRFDATGSGRSLDATAEWNLTADLPVTGANLGLEGITWIPDSALVKDGFVDAHAHAPYDPSAYPDHGDGLFFVGLEGNGTIYAYALDQSGSGFTRVATIASGFPAVMELQYDVASDRLWAVCDDTCQGQTATLQVAAAGRFAVTKVYNRPSGMPNLNNEGFAFAAQSECVGGVEPVYWSDDTDDDGHALRAGTIDCTGTNTRTDTKSSDTNSSDTAHTTQTAASSELAATGVGLGDQLIVVVLALGLGVIALLLGRRRRA